jgi:hypothetical protein
MHARRELVAFLISEIIPLNWFNCALTHQHLHLKSSDQDADSCLKAL